MRSKQRGAVFTLFATMVVIATAAHAQQNMRNFYDSHGAFAGAARTHGNATTFTDKRGRFVGSAINRGNGTALHARRPRRAPPSHGDVFGPCGLNRPIGPHGP